MAFSAAQLQTQTDRAMADPGVRAALQAWADYHQRTGHWSDAHGVSTFERQFYQALHDAGIPMDGMSVDFRNVRNGTITLTNSGLPGWAYPLIIGGIAVGGLGAAGAFGGLGGAAGAGAGGGSSAFVGPELAGATGGGVGLGETAAVTGLTGSGFGTGAGLGLTSVGAGAAIPAIEQAVQRGSEPFVGPLPENAHDPSPSNLDQVKKLLGLTGSDNDLLPVIIRALAGLGAGALAPNFFQPRKSFEGTGADPTNWLTDARSAIGGAYNAAAARANEPTDFSGARVTKPANRSGGGQDFGLTASPDALNAGLGPKRVPLQFAPMPTTHSNRPRTTTPAGPAVPRAPTTPGTGGRTNPNPGGGDIAVPRRPPTSSPTSSPQVQPGQQNLDNLFSAPTGAQPQPGDSPGRASARLLLSSLIAQQQPQPGQGGQG